MTVVVVSDPAEVTVETVVDPGSAIVVV